MWPPPAGKGLACHHGGHPTQRRHGHPERPERGLLRGGSRRRAQAADARQSGGAAARAVDGADHAGPDADAVPRCRGGRSPAVRGCGTTPRAADAHHGHAGSRMDHRRRPRLADRAGAAHARTVGLHGASRAVGRHPGHAAQRHLRLFEASGHQPFYEEPERFTATVTEWLSSEGSPGRSPVWSGSGTHRRR